MCITDDCNNEGTQGTGIERRTFLTGATAAAVVGVTLASERFAQVPCRILLLNRRH